MPVWRGGVMVRALDLGTKDGGDRRPFRFQVTTLGKLFIHMYFCHQTEVNFVPVVRR